jgi:hypothetical protein
MYDTHGEVFRLLQNLYKLNVMDATDILNSSKDMQPQLGGLERIHFRK